MAQTTVGHKLGGNGAMKANGKAAATAKSSAKGAKKAETRRRGVVVPRHYTTAGTDPLDEVTWERRTSVITNPDGSVVFKMEGAEIPAGWSQLATDIVVSKYFRKAGLHGNKDVGETSVRQVVYRLAHTIREAGESLGGYFATKKDADTFESELSYMLVNQIGAFNSPVWFNCGLFHRYGIEGSGGNFAWDAETDAIVETKNAYEKPQCSACFIQKVEDDLMAMYELVKSEARLFKYGSGTGSNFSAIRGKQEKLSGGGTSSGLMSFLEVFDRAAGATKSGGTTRRAAKMVCLDMDHPEIMDFIQWKVREEKKAHALIAAGFPSDFNGEAYHTISGQNSNNSIRVTDDFMRAVEAGGTWQTRARTTGDVVDTYQARDLWNAIGDSAWGCADPGVQYDTTINKWHTCPNTDRINASNPCSEYMFLDDSACNLASLNLTKFLREDATFDVAAYRHATRVFFMAQEILVDFSAYPTKGIAKNSHDYRPLGLGYANLGSLLMLLGIPYDSDQGRSMAGALTAILCGHAYKTSAEMAGSKGAFNGFAKNREPMLKVMRMHRDAAYQIDRDACPETLWRAACEDWDGAVALGQEHGYRNAQATVLAPTGTIGLLMDCDTTGVEPDFALVKFKKLAGGGYFKIVNQSVPAALRHLGYSEAEAQEIVAFVSGTNTLLAAPNVNRATLKARGFTDADLAKVENAIPGVFDLELAFGSWILGDEAYARFGAPESRRPGFSLLKHLGFSAAEIEEANDTIVGRMTIEGAPYLRSEHYAVFDCANRCGKTGVRYLLPMSHVKMMAATQPFLSGAISKTVNLPNESSVDEVREIYEEGWRLGLKAVALYRDGCKASQPLSTSSKDKDKDKEEAKASATMPPAAAVAATAMAPEARTTPHGYRVRLPKKRSGFTQEARVGGHKIFLRTGEYADGTLGEIFVDMHKEGAAFRSLMNCFAMSVSVGLQYGVPLETFVEQFTFTRFEPQGSVEGHPNIKLATSIVDYIFRVLGVEYQSRYDLAHVKPEPQIQDPAESHYQEPPSIMPMALAQAPLAATSHASLNEGIGSALDQQLEEMMGDAPVCDSCGHITVRNGACYKCLNCGNSMGCSLVGSRVGCRTPRALRRGVVVLCARPARGGGATLGSRTGCADLGAPQSHGFTRVTPRPSKWRTLRVARTAPRRDEQIFGGNGPLTAFCAETTGNPRDGRVDGHHLDDPRLEKPLEPRLEAFALGAGRRRDSCLQLEHGGGRERHDGAATQPGHDRARRRTARRLRDHVRVDDVHGVTLRTGWAGPPPTASEA
jgi:ribonucleoside-diphosphate reductase alpha chain